MDELIEKLKSLVYFEGTIKKIIEELNYSISELELAKNKIASAYIIDDECADLKKIEDCYNKLVEKRDYLNTQCRNLINSSKNNINQSIENYND